MPPATPAAAPNAKRVIAMASDARSRRGMLGRLMTSIGNWPMIGRLDRRQLTGLTRRRMGAGGGGEPARTARDLVKRMCTNNGDTDVGRLHAYL